MKQRFVIYASDVASVAGLHPYRPKVDAFFKIWHQCIKQEIYEPPSESDKPDIELREDEIKWLIDENSSMCSFIKSASSVSSTPELNKKIESLDHLAKPLIDQVGEINREKVINAVRSKVRCEFGTKQELSAIDLYEKQFNTSVMKRNDKVYGKEIYNCDDFMIYVCGKVDGIKQDGTVIEVKNRMRWFFNPLPKYDVAQLQTYLFLLDAPEGELVEQLKLDTSQIKRTKIERDRAFWSDVLQPRIVAFCNAINRFYLDEELRKRYAYSNTRGQDDLLNTLLD